MHHTTPLKTSQSFLLLSKTTNFAPAANTALMIDCGALGLDVIEEVPTTVSTPTPHLEQKKGGAEIADPAPKKIRKRRVRILPELSPPEKPKWMTIPQTAQRYPVFTEKALRHIQAQAEAFHRYPKAGLKSNGFIDCIIRPANQNRILIDTEKFEQWLGSYAVVGCSIQLIKENK